MERELPILEEHRLWKQRPEPMYLNDLP